MLQTIDISSLPPLPVVLQGRCAGCGRGIPEGYLPRVTKSHSETRQGYQKVVFDELWCKECWTEVLASSKPHVRYDNTVSTPALTAKEIATKLLAVVGKDAKSAKKLAQAASIDYEQHKPVVRSVLGKLTEAGILTSEKEDTGLGKVTRWKKGKR